MSYLPQWKTLMYEKMGMEVHNGKAYKTCAFRDAPLNQFGVALERGLCGMHATLNPRKDVVITMSLDPLVVTCEKCKDNIDWDNFRALYYMEGERNDDSSWV